MVDRQRMDLFLVKRLVWTWLLPFLCLFGIGANVINIFIFSIEKGHSKNRLHAYLRIDSLVECCYLVIGLVHFVLKIINPDANYYIIAYDKYFYNYLASSLAFFMLFIKLFITIKRLLITCNHRIRLKAFKLKRLLSYFFFISFLFDIPLLIGLAIQVKETSPYTCPVSDVSQNCSTTRYYLSYQMSETPYEIKILFYSSSSFRGLVAPIMLLIFNMIFLRKLTQKIKFIRKIVNQTSRKIDSGLLYKGKIMLMASFLKKLIEQNSLILPKDTSRTEATWAKRVQL